MRSHGVWIFYFFLLPRLRPFDHSYYYAHSSINPLPPTLSSFLSLERLLVLLGLHLVEVRLHLLGVVLAVLLLRHRLAHDLDHVLVLQLLCFGGVFV